MNWKNGKITVNCAEEFYQAVKQGYLFYRIEMADEVKKQVFSYVQKQEDDSVKWNTLGNCYYHGNYGVEKNFNEAVKWYRKAAEQENVFAQCNLAYCYESGEGVEKDLHQAVIWYRK